MKQSFVKLQDNTISVTHALTKALSVRITNRTLTEKLKAHPNYPSLHAVSDVLKIFKIQNFAIQISTKELSEVPTPCIAALNTEGGIFALINSVKNDIIEWTHSEKGQQQENISTFSEKWNGILLLAESNEESGEKNYTLNRRYEIIDKIRLKILVLGGVISIVLISYLSLSSIKFSIFLPLLLLTKGTGIVVSVLLLWYLLDKSHPFLKNICQIKNESDCSSVLDSKAASIGGIVSWSEIGFFYFFGSFLAFLLGASNQVTLSALAYINLFTLPYTVFSIYFQVFISKRWCILCLSIQVLLWIEFFFFFFAYGYLIPTFTNGHDIAVLFFSFIFPIVVWFSLKPILKDWIKGAYFEKSLNKFQNNTTIFKYLLSEQRVMLVLPLGMPIIEIGKMHSPNIITIVTSPFCTACFDIHSIVTDIVNENEDLIKCQFVFWATNRPNDKRGDFVRHLYTIDESQRTEAFESWFSKKYNFEEWQKIYPIERNNENTFDIVNQNEKWCIESNTRFTPTIFINGHLLPNLYSLEDIKRIAPYIFSEYE